MFGSRSAMKVPEPVRRVFDTFPLAVYRDEELEERQRQAATRDNTRLFVYATDSGTALEPTSLAAQALLALSPAVQHFEVHEASPLMTSAECLPVVLDGEAMVDTSSALLKRYFPNATWNSKVDVYIQLVNTWLRDAWLATIMEPSNAAVKKRLYLADRDRRRSGVLALVVGRQIDTHLSAQRPYQDQNGGAVDWTKAELALLSLEELLDGAKFFGLGDLGVRDLGSLGFLDILVYSYVWPLMKQLPACRLAQFVGQGLRAHATRVHVAVFSGAGASASANAAAHAGMRASTQHQPTLATMQ